MSLLHSVESMPALLPRYVSRFRCLGSDCEETCCRGWGVSIDQASYEAYTQGSSPLLPQPLHRHFERMPAPDSRENFARIKHEDQTGYCPFLEQNLCSIHRDLGEDKIPDVCFSFPRYTRKTDGLCEQVLTLSCPEAARLALLAPDAFDFVEGEARTRSATLGIVQQKHGLSLAEMSDVRFFCFQLMRTESLDIWERLALVGFFCDKLDKVIQGNGDQGVSGLINDFVTLIENGELVGPLSEIQPNFGLQVSLFYTIWNTRRAQQKSGAHQSVQERVAAGLCFREGTGELELEASVLKYRKGLASVQVAISDFPYLFDHYVLNEMFRDFFPFGSASVYENYLGIVSRFCLLRFMLAAMSADDDKAPDKAMIVKGVWVFCRIYQHGNLSGLSGLALKEVGWDKIENIYGLLRTGT